ncbi:Uncharacterized protein dnl_35650 [Desulfonema limicola]|uniref:Uncharacterized protein n=1 Tax=Desulfonema limicola TaxID=45656 RepID=A0A975B9J0_9BACT|nr:Uncharacterized protein dnl_35650 [Desulfonema limicola]
MPPDLENQLNKFTHDMESWKNMISAKEYGVNMSADSKMAVICNS